MPIYQFIHPETEEVIEVLQSMKQDHVYIDEHGVEWNRVWNVLKLLSTHKLTIMTKTLG